MTVNANGTKVTVVDYGAGNLLSVSRALNRVGARVVMAESPGAVRRAGHLILPGVGAFARGMEELRRHGLIEPLLDHAKSGKPFLGICLGMQMMLESSDEFGDHEGLGLIPGKVAAIPKTTTEDAPHKIPHIGWIGLHPADGADWDGTLLSGLPAGANMYFVHSFTAHPADTAHRLADVDYNGRTLSAAIRRDNLTGFQGHPEKSGQVGLDILGNFVRLD
jgi:glutamine amidotransferase